MGFIEETGAAQYVRDARITTIYEGTTGIQSNDLIGRKIGRDRGAAMNALMAEMSREPARPRVRRPRRCIAAALDAVQLLEASTDSLAERVRRQSRSRARRFSSLSDAVRICHRRLADGTLGSPGSGAPLAARSGNSMTRRSATARFFAQQMLPNARATGAGGAARRGQCGRSGSVADLTMNRREWICGGLSVMAAARSAAQAQVGSGLILRRIPSSGEQMPIIGLGTSGPFEVGAFAAAARATA